MDNTYFVGFLQGTSGRFISSIMWSLANDLRVQARYTEFNSAHIDTFCCVGWKLNYKDPCDLLDSFRRIEFDRTKTNINPNGIGLYYSHSYPDFDTISSRFPDSKVVIVGITESDYKEIAANYLFKNGVEDIGLPLFPERLKLLYKRLYNKEYTGPFTENEIFAIINLYAEWMHSMPHATDYYKHEIPEKYSNNILLIMYSDIYTQDSEGKFTVYERLKDFMGCQGNEIIEENYRNYVLGRDKLLSTHLYWINDEHYRTNTNAALIP